MAVSARSAYIIDVDEPESIRCIGHGKHQVCGGRQIIALESDDRLFIAPLEDCVLEYAAGEARLVGRNAGRRNVTVSVKNMSQRTITTSPDIGTLFRCVSGICAMPGETSPYRSHPFYRPAVPDICISAAGPGPAHDSPRSPISLHLPPDLRYLYAAAPLSYYLGAAIDAGGRPQVEISGRSIDLPGDYGHFERWAGNMLSRTFQMDCAVRCSARTGKNLSGIDVLAMTGYAPEELMLMSMPDRFMLYQELLRSGGRAFTPWHLASYVDPVPSSTELLPYLLRSLSAVYSAKSTCLTERDVVSLSVRNYKARLSGRVRGDFGQGDTVVLPSLFNAQAHYWYSDGCPVDASLSSLEALRNGRKYARDRRLPAVCIVCNEQTMVKEAILLKDMLEGMADVDVRMCLDRDDLRHTFSEGFDIVHYAGHSERQGLKCRDGFADLSSIDESDVPVFFLNSCFSYLQGTRLIEKGSVCGIATMFRLLDEAAVDVCTNFYRMLASGYPVITSYLGARECSVTGKEYLLIGDGSYTVFNSSASFMPFYKLSRNGLGFTLQCKITGGEKGLIACHNGRFAIPDTGFEVACQKAADLRGPGDDLDGMCLYGGCIYDNVAGAVRAALVDLRHDIGASRAKTSGP